MISFLIRKVTSMKQNNIWASRKRRKNSRNFIVEKEDPPHHITEEYSVLCCSSDANDFLNKSDMKRRSTSKGVLPLISLERQRQPLVGFDKATYDSRHYAQHHWKWITADDKRQSSDRESCSYPARLKGDERRRRAEWGERLIRNGCEVVLEW